MAIGTVFTAPYAPQYPNAGWTNGVLFTVCCHMTIDGFYGSGSISFASINGGGAGSGAVLTFNSGVNCTIKNVTGNGWAKCIQFVNTCPTTLPDCQGFLMTEINGIGTNNLISAVGTLAQYPNGLCGITIESWQCDDGYAGGGKQYVYGPLFDFTNANGIFIGKGLGLLAVNSPNPGALFTNCSDIIIGTAAEIYAAGPGGAAVHLTGGTTDVTVQGCRLKGTVGLSVDAGCARISSVGNNYHLCGTAIVDPSNAVSSVGDQKS